MSVNTARFNLLFGVKGQNGLTRVRSDILGVQRVTYGAANAMSRSYSALDKNIMRSSNSIEKSLRGVLTGFRLLGGISLAKLGIGGLMSVAGAMNKAFIHTNQQLMTSKIILEELMGKTNSANFMDTIQAKSFQFGQDLNETMTASRGLLQVMKQVSAISGRSVAPKDLDKLLQATMAINTMDTENRSLSFTAFSVKEIMDGNGGMDWTSMRRRNQINIGKENQKKITGLFKKGELTEGIDLFLKNLDRIGIKSGALLKRMMNENFGTNISRLQGYISMSFQRIGIGMFTSLIRPLAKLNNFIASNFGADGFLVKEFGSMSNKMADFFNPAIDRLIDFGSQVRSQGNVIIPLIRQMFGTGADVASTGFGTAKGFFTGIFEGAGGTGGVSALISGMTTLNRLGEGLRSIFYQIQDPVNQLGEAIGETVKEIAKLMGGGKGNFANNLATILGGLANGLNGIIRVANLIPQGLNKVAGNDNVENRNGGQDYLSKAMSYGMMGLIVAGMFKGKMPKFGKGAGLTTGGAMMAEEAVVAESGLARNPHIGALETVEARNAQKVMKLNEQISSIGNLDKYKSLGKNRGVASLLSGKIADREAQIAILESKFAKEVERGKTRGLFEPLNNKKLNSLQQEIMAKKATIGGYKNKLNITNREISAGEYTESLFDKREALSRKGQAIGSRISSFTENVGAKLGKYATVENAINGFFLTQIGGSITKGFGKMFPTLTSLLTTPVKGMFSVIMGGLRMGLATLAGWLALAFTPLVIGVGAVVLAFGGLSIAMDRYGKLKAEQESAEYKKLGLGMGKQTRDYSDSNNLYKAGVGTKFLQNFFSHGWGGGKIQDMQSFAALWHFKLNPENKRRLTEVAGELKSHKISDNGFNNITGNDKAASFMHQLEMVVSGKLEITKFDKKIQDTFIKAINDAQIEHNTKAVGEGKIVDPNAKIDYTRLAEMAGKNAN